jgi:hypothetical protein
MLGFPFKMIQEDTEELEKKIAHVVVKVDGSTPDEASNQYDTASCVGDEPSPVNIATTTLRSSGRDDERQYFEDFLKKEGTQGRHALQIRQYILNWASQEGRTIPQMVNYIRNNEMPEIIQKAFEYASEQTIGLLKQQAVCQPPPELMKAIFKKYQSISDKFEKNRVEV